MLELFTVFTNEGSGLSLARTRSIETRGHPAGTCMGYIVNLQSSYPARIESYSAAFDRFRRIITNEQGNMGFGLTDCPKTTFETALLHQSRPLDSLIP